MPVTITKEEAEGKGKGEKRAGCKIGGPEEKYIKLAICLVKNLQPASS